MKKDTKDVVWVGGPEDGVSLRVRADAGFIMVATSSTTPGFIRPTPPRGVEGLEYYTVPIEWTDRGWRAVWSSKTEGW